MLSFWILFQFLTASALRPIPQNNLADAHLPLFRSLDLNQDGRLESAELQGPFPQEFTSFVEENPSVIEEAHTTLSKTGSLDEATISQLLSRRRGAATDSSFLLVLSGKGKKHHPHSSSPIGASYVKVVPVASPVGAREHVRPIAVEADTFATTGSHGHSYTGPQTTVQPSTPPNPQTTVQPSATPNPQTVQPSTTPNPQTTVQPSTTPNPQTVQPTKPSDSTKKGSDSTKTDPTTSTPTHPTKTGLDPTKTGLDPTKTGLDPTKTGLDPTKTGLDPTKTDPTHPKTGSDPTQTNSQAAAQTTLRRRMR